MTFNHLIAPKIAIRFPNWLGDAVMATPILQGILNAIPKAQIHVIATEAICSLLKGLPIDSFIQTQSSGKARRKSRSELVQRIHQESFDAGILLTGSFSTAWELYRANIPIRIGFKTHFRSPLLTHPIDLPSDIEAEHLVITYQRLLNELYTPKNDKDQSLPQKIYDPALTLSDDEIQKARRTLESFDILPHHILIGINPGAAYGSAKCWPKERFRLVTETLITDPRARIIYFGDLNGKPLVDEICARLSPRVVNLAGKTSLRELMAHISLLNLLVTNDSGPMHLASALGVPTVSLFGSTNPYKTGPWAFGHILYRKVACSPCYLRKCPIDFRCMYEITPKMVLETIQEAICTSKTH